MKKVICIALILMVFMLLLPLCGLKSKGQNAQNNQKELQVAKSADILTKEFRVYDKESDKVTKMSAEDYIFGVVAAEMPALYHNEALKAQAVAAYTYTLYKLKQNEDKDYDITTDYTIDQSFIALTEAKEKWGENSDKYIKKIKEAVQTVSGEALYYNGEVALTVYHAVSGGTTYSAKDVWSKEIPYLQSVSSEGDKLANNYVSKVEFSKSELKKRLNSAFNIKDKDEILSDRETTELGLVKTVKVFGQKISGSDLRETLELNSSNFDFEQKNGKYIFTVYGYGHGVGMSQYGADYMAKQGYTYKEILAHYYTDCEILIKN